MISVPRVMGIAIWSPGSDMDFYRGVRFCKLLTQNFALSVFDSVMPTDGKLDPTKALDEQLSRVRAYEVGSSFLLLFSFLPAFCKSPSSPAP